MDRPFRFRLERVRAIKERREDQAKEELAASLAAQHKSEEALRAATEGVDDARAAHRGKLAAGRADPRELMALQAYLERVERFRGAAALDLDRCRQEVKARRTALEAAVRERQVLERLKDRQRAHHVLESARLEGAAVDEMALTIHRRAMEVS